ncbi:MAG: YHYH domain-containing protein [Pseudomonadota bacterium]
MSTRKKIRDAATLAIFFPVLVGMVLAPLSAQGHGGGLDKYGCHHNRKIGEYHCHRAGAALPPHGREREAPAPQTLLQDSTVRADTLTDRGTLNPNVTQATITQTICVPGYTKSVRPATSYTNGVKRILMQRAGINPAVASYYELDHIIPLALGGHPRKLDNLELQIWEGENGAKRKDRIEVKLQCLVCSGQVKLATAQREILDNWQAAYHKYARVKCHRQKAAPNRR